jgi:hypothetical protein
MSAFFKRFIAKYSPVFLFLANITRPKEPTLASDKEVVLLTGAECGGQLIV